MLVYFGHMWKNIKGRQSIIVSYSLACTNNPEPESYSFACWWWQCHVDNVLQQCTSIKQVKKQLLHIILPTYLKDALTLYAAFTSTLTLLTSHGQRTKIIYPVQTLAVVLLSYKLHHRNISFKCVRIKEQP